ncbi:relaxase/mobilization nuclease domain-containing protein [Streptomyces sp. NRRL S-118]|uniref:relaxase/mobilization nuclease domain-containing protein n=1 Tax=Streptomyces sp. NRRL S-118 TaxID=1463881 RepID=UPI000694930D|nr:relaxase/mobilization nuclease domain-containing protein [Streptomyces sp. NRRL S-118]
MIANITKGKKAVGALIYDFGPGRRDEHVNPRIVAGNVTGTPLQVARAIDHTARRRPEIAAPIWRCSLSLPDEDGILPDAQWADIASKFVADMGFATAPWVAVRHGDDHIHLTVSRVDWAGQLLTDRWDYRRAREAADVLEEEHGLVRARDRFRAEGPQVRNNELEASNRRRGPDAAVPPEREELRRIIREVRDASRGLGRDAFESGLADAGVAFRANVASTGRMNGYSFTLDGLVDGAGEQVWYPASKVAKDLRWAALGPVLGDPPPTAADARQAAAVATSTTAVPVLEDQEQADVEEFVRLATKMLRDGEAERGVPPVDTDNPALSTDPARRLLAQWQMKQRGQEPPAEEVPAAPAAIPAWTDKRRRPYGRLGTQALARELADAEKATASWRRDQETAEAQVRAWDAVATGAVRSENVRRLHELRDAVAKAAPHLADVERHMKTAVDAERAADAGREVWRKADSLKNLSRYELWRQGTSRKEQEKIARETGDDVQRLARTAYDARAAASKAAEAARKASGLRDPEAEVARLTEQWPELLREAQRQDQEAGRLNREHHRRAAATAAKNAAATQARVEKLRQEQQLRQTMPEGQRDAENKARSAEAARARSTTTKKAGQTRRRGYQPPGEQPPHLRQPPPGQKGPRKGL